MKKTVHYCHAAGCGADIAWDKLFCDAHWMKISKAAKTQLVMLYSHGKPMCGCGHDLGISEKIHQALNAAAEELYQSEFKTGGHS